MVDQVEGWAAAMVAGTGVNAAQVMFALRERFDDWLLSPLDAAIDTDAGRSDLDRLHRFLLGVA
jgi:hypothetical protein